MKLKRKKRKPKRRIKKKLHLGGMAKIEETHICGLFSCTCFRFSELPIFKVVLLANRKSFLQRLLLRLFFFFWFFLFALPCVWFLRSFCGFFSATFFFEFSRLLLDIMQSTLLFSSHTHTHFSRFSFLAMLFNFFLPAGFLPDGSWLLLCHLRF